MQIWPWLSIETHWDLGVHHFEKCPYIAYHAYAYQHIPTIVIIWTIVMIDPQQNGWSFGSQVYATVCGVWDLGCFFGQWTLFFGKVGYPYRVSSFCLHWNGNTLGYPPILGKPMQYCVLYPLVNVYITMENHHFSWENPLFLWPFSIATSAITRGYHTWGLGFGMILPISPGQFFRKNAMVRAQKRGKHWTLVARLSTLAWEIPTV